MCCTDVTIIIMMINIMIIIHITDHHHPMCKGMQGRCNLGGVSAETSLKSFFVKTRQLRHRSTYKDINPVPTVTKVETHSRRVHVSDNDSIWKLFLWLSSWPVKNRQSARRTGPQGTKCHILFQKLLGFTVVQEVHFETLVYSAPSLLFCTI